MNALAAIAFTLLGIHIGAHQVLPIGYAPTWSPDAQRIAFITRGNLWDADADGTHLAKLTDDADQPAWSPNGRRIAFTRDGGLPFVSKWVSSVSPKYRTPVAAIWTAAVLEFLFVWLAQTVSVGGTNIYTIVVNATLIFLFLSFTVPIAIGFFVIGTPKWPKMGPWNMGIPLYRLFALLSVLGMVIIIFVAIQPPNDKVLYITVAFLLLAAVIWVVFENWRFKGPPMGEMIAKRQAEILAAEKAVGET